MKKLLREPLLHFLLLGAVLFAVSGVLTRRTGSEPGKIIISQARIQHLAAGFAGTWLRAPTAEELDGLIREYIREEVYYREAMAMGLDRDDAIIRRRLRQKLEFVAADIAGLTQPTDEELRVFLQDHPDTFRNRSRFTFRQAFLNRERHGESLKGDAAELLRQLQQIGNGSDISLFGDPTLLESQFAEVDERDVAKQFGQEFAAALADLPIGEWRGPIYSSYGAHLVVVEQRREARSPALEEVREAVRREWNNVHRQHMARKFYDGLLKQYAVIIEPRLSVVGGGEQSAAK